MCLYKELERYSLEQLESLAVDLYARCFSVEKSITIFRERPKADDLRFIESAPSLRDLLNERKCRLNHAFTFTAESAARFAKISDHLTECIVKAQAEAKPVVEELERRLEKNDPFLIDYEAELTIEPYLAGSDGGWATIHGVIEGVLRRSSAELKVKPRAGIDPYDIYTDREENWNAVDTLHSHENELAEYYIGYAMHELCDHSVWSLSDILQIERIWVDVNITRQHERELWGS